MIIALSGIPGAGKDTVGEALRLKMNHLKHLFKTKKSIGKVFTIKKFAKEANGVFAGITNINYSSLPREEKEQYRPMFIDFAEGMKEMFGQDIWAKKLLNKHGELSNNWIITDLRFYEELNLLKNLDPDVDIFMFRIRRNCNECGMIETHKPDCSQNNITSVETKLAGYLGWDKIIVNNDTPEEAAELIVNHILDHYGINRPSIQ